MINFAIVSELRSGYQMLSASLNTHPQIMCFGEIFGSDPAIRKKSLFGKPLPIIEPHDYPPNYVRTLESWVKTQNKTVLGFKLNYVCARQPNWLVLWEHMVKQKWKIIHLMRLNLLDRFLSEQLASAENKWNTQRYTSTLKVDPNHFFMCCDRTFVWREETINFFQENEVLDVFYEDLEYRPEYVFELVQRFFGVPVRSLGINTIKQQTRPQSQIVENYRELMETTRRFRPELLLHFKDVMML